MKTLLNFNKIFILGLLIILSCDEQNPLQPTIEFNYDLQLELSTSGNLYADSCPDCTNDPEQIKFSINLTNGSELAAEKTITIYSIPANEESPSNIEFQIAPVVTSTSGLASFVYDDNGYDGSYHVIASFTDSETDSTIRDTSNEKNRGACSV